MNGQSKTPDDTGIREKDLCMVHIFSTGDVKYTKSRRKCRDERQRSKHRNQAGNRWNTHSQLT